MSLIGSFSVLADAGQERDSAQGSKGQGQLCGRRERTGEEETQNSPLTLPSSRQTKTGVKAERKREVESEQELIRWLMLRGLRKHLREQSLPRLAGRSPKNHRRACENMGGAKWPEGGRCCLNPTPRISASPSWPHPSPPQASFRALKRPFTLALDPVTTSPSETVLLRSRDRWELPTPVSAYLSSRVLSRSDRTIRVIRYLLSGKATATAEHWSLWGFSRVTGTVT